MQYNDLLFQMGLNELQYILIHKYNFQFLLQLDFLSQEFQGKIL